MRRSRGQPPRATARRYSFALRVARKLGQQRWQYTERAPGRAGPADPKRRAARLRAPRQPDRVGKGGRRRMAARSWRRSPSARCERAGPSLITHGPVADHVLARLQRRFGLPQCHRHQPASRLLTQVASSDDARNRLQELSQGSRAPFVVVVQKRCLVKDGYARRSWARRGAYDASYRPVIQKPVALTGRGGTR
jgi:hypothetical protein